MKKIVWSGRTSAFAHKHKFDPSVPLPPDTQEGLRQVWFLDAQWSTCPIEVEDQVKALWRLDDRLHNDVCIIKTSINDLRDGYEDSEVDTWNESTQSWVKGPIKTDAILQWIEETRPEIKPDDLIVIHWWW